ncbi:MAG: hypothetical protein DSY60_00595 [Persephonella sp.]|nr:MAG: hypothetical protein DSY60_00595 [Persephonella sp.]
MKKMNNFINKYASQVPKVHRLRKFFEKLEDNECFFIFQNKNLTAKEVLYLELYLVACSENKSFEDLTKEFSSAVEFLNIYDMKVYGIFE